MYLTFVVLLVSAISCAFSVLLIRYARRLKLIDNPNHRSLHAVPVPRSGGIAIAIALLAGVFLLSANRIWAVPAKVSVFLSGAFAMGVLGFLSDRYELSARLRLVFQLGISLAVLLIGGKYRTVEFFGMRPDLGIAGLFFFALWLTAVTNFYNFMDGIDGLAAMQAVVAGLAMALFGITSGRYYLLGLGLVIFAACAGFALLNFNPAKIFMGDSGSYLLGFLIASAALFEPWLFMPVVLVLSVFLFDTKVTLLRRILNREKWHQAHRSHFYQRAVLLGYTHKQVTGTLSWVFIFAVGAGYCYLNGGLAIKIAAFTATICLLCALALFVIRKEVKHVR